MTKEKIVFRWKYIMKICVNKIRILSGANGVENGY